MKRKSYKVDIAILIVLVITIFTMSAAYAALSKTLNLTYGNAIVRELYWEPIWKTETITVTTTGGAQCSMDTNQNTMSINVDEFYFTAPGQTCTAKATMYNDSSGYIAKVQAVNFIAPTGISCTSSNGAYTCGLVRYRLCWDSSCSNRVQVNDTVGEDATRDVYLIVDVPSTSTYTTGAAQNDGRFSMIFEQVDA